MVDDQDACEWVNVSSGTGSTFLHMIHLRSCKIILDSVHKLA